MPKVNQNSRLPEEKMMTQEKRLLLYKETAEIIETIAKRRQRQLILDEKEFLEHGNIWIDEMDIKRIPLSDLFLTRKGMLLQETAFLEKLFSEDRWQKMGWKVELLNDDICCWPDKIEGGRSLGFHIALFWKPKL